MKLATPENFSVQFSPLQLSQIDLKTLMFDELKPEKRVAEKSVIFGKKIADLNKNMVDWFPNLHDYIDLQEPLIPIIR